MPTNLYGTEDNYHPINNHVMPSLKVLFKKEQCLSSITCWGSGNVLRNSYM